MEYDKKEMVKQAKETSEGNLWVFHKKTYGFRKHDGIEYTFPVLIYKE